MGQKKNKFGSGAIAVTVIAVVAAYVLMVVTSPAPDKHDDGFTKITEFKYSDLSAKVSVYTFPENATDNDVLLHARSVRNKQNDTLGVYYFSNPSEVGGLELAGAETFRDAVKFVRQADPQKAMSFAYGLQILGGEKFENCKAQKDRPLCFTGYDFWYK